MPGLLEEEKKRLYRPVPQLPLAEDTDPQEMEKPNKAESSGAWDADAVKKAIVGKGDSRLPPPRKWPGAELI